MAWPAATAASMADCVFSMIPAAASCNPRCAMGRAISQSRPAMPENAGTKRSIDFERAFYLDGRIQRQRRYAHRGAGMPAPVAEDRNHQVGCAVHHLGSVGKAGSRIDEAAEPDHPDDLVEVAEAGLDLGQQVDGTSAGRPLPVFDRHFAAEPALGDELAVGAETDLSGYEHEISSANEGNVIGDRGFRLGQGNAQFGKLLLHGSSHDVLLGSPRGHLRRPAGAHAGRTLRRANARVQAAARGSVAVLAQAAYVPRR